MAQQDSLQGNSERRQSEYRWICCLVVFYTFIIIKYSYLFGNLASLPNYDDSVYMLDAAKRLQIFYEKGFHELFTNLKNEPPHSPFSTSLAMLAFSIFGLQYWAPYIFNVVVVGALLLFVNRLLDGLAPWQKRLSYIFVLCMPFVVKSVSEFRPDIACGLVTAGGAIYALRRPCVSAGWKRSAIAGGIFAAGMLIKPSAWIMTLGIFVGTLGLSAISDYILSTEPSNKWKCVRGIIAAFATFVLLCLPYYRTEWKVLYEYLRANLVDLKDVWQLHDPLKVRLRFYLDGDGGKFMLGKYVYIFAFILAVSYITIILKRMKIEIVRFGSYLIVMLVAYAVPSVKTFNTPYFAATFHAMLLLVTICFFHLYLLHPVFQGIQRKLINATFFTVCLLGVLATEPPNYMGNRFGPVFMARERTAQEVFEAIKDSEMSSGNLDSAIYFTFFGNINDANIGLKFLAEGLHVPRFEGTTYSDVVAKQQAAIARADIVVASEPGNCEVYNWLPISTIQGKLIELLRADPAFVEVKSIPAQNMKAFVIFQRRSAFWGLKPLQGMAGIEGPYPQWDLGIVNWGLYPMSRLSFTTNDSEPKMLSISARDDLAGQIMTATIDGKLILTHTFASSELGHFVDLSTTVSVPSGAHELRFSYTAGMPVDVKPMAVLFEKLAILPQVH